MENPKYKRVLLKISGEALAGDATRGLDFNVIGQVCDVVKRCVQLGVQVGIVVGGGNFWRGVKDGGDRMVRVRADHMGMLATAINALAVADVLEQKGVEVRVQTAIEMRAMASLYPLQGHPPPGEGPRGHLRLRDREPLLLHGYGGGAPGGGDRRDVILLAKNIDGVYSADPRKVPDAVKYDSITYSDVLAQRLQVMDSTATSLSMDNKIPVLLFA